MAPLESLVLVVIDTSSSSVDAFAYSCKHHCEVDPPIPIASLEPDRVGLVESSPSEDEASIGPVRDPVLSQLLVLQVLVDAEGVEVGLIEAPLLWFGDRVEQQPP